MKDLLGSRGVVRTLLLGPLGPRTLSPRVLPARSDRGVSRRRYRPRSHAVPVLVPAKMVKPARKVANLVARDLVAVLAEGNLSPLVVEAVRLRVSHLKAHRMAKTHIKVRAGTS